MQSTLFSLALVLASTSAFAQTSGTRADLLKEKFEAAGNPLTMKAIVGAYLGRCFDEGSDLPRGMILSTISQIMGANEGPLFAPTSVYSMALVERTRSDGTEDTYTTNDSTTFDQVQSFWKNPHYTVNFGSGWKLLPIQFGNARQSNDTINASSQGETISGGGTISLQGHLRIKKGADGFLYVKSEFQVDRNGEPLVSKLRLIFSPPRYCYFWKKLF